MYICVFVCIFVYIFVYLCIFLYIRTYLQKMRRAICDKKIPGVPYFFFDVHQLSKIFENFQMSKNVKNWFFLTPRLPSDSPNPPKINFLMNFQKIQNLMKLNAD